MYLLAIARVDRIRLGLITIPGIRALVIDFNNHTRSHRASIVGKRIALGRDMPTLAAAFADTGDYIAGTAVDAVATFICAAGVSKVVGGGETGAAEFSFQSQYRGFEGTI